MLVRVGMEVSIPSLDAATQRQPPKGDPQTTKTDLLLSKLVWWLRHPFEKILAHEIVSFPTKGFFGNQTIPKEKIFEKLHWGAY